MWINIALGRNLCLFFAFDRDAPFSKEELTAILKFRAEELFKEADGEETELPVRFICDFTWDLHNFKF